MEQFAIGANFESAAARRNERERFDSFAEFKNLGRQTDGLGRVVSDDAIFDRDFRLHSGVLLSGKNGTELGKGGQGAREFSRRESVGTVRRRAVAETFYDRPSNPFPSALCGAMRGLLQICHPRLLQFCNA